MKCLIALMTLCVILGAEVSSSLVDDPMGFPSNTQLQGFKKEDCKACVQSLEMLVPLFGVPIGDVIKFCWLCAHDPEDKDLPQSCRDCYTAPYHCEHTCAFEDTACIRHCYDVVAKARCDQCKKDLKPKKSVPW